MGKAKINAKKVTVDGMEFDSQTEAEYYQYLKTLDGVAHIECQPHYLLIGNFDVMCSHCDGIGKVKSEKTDNMIQCSKCRGTKVRTRKSWSYTPDFDVTYSDGRKETIDVKGHANERFPLVKKMWEYRHKRELIVVKKKGKGWVRK